MLFLLFFRVSGPSKWNFRKHSFKEHHRFYLKHLKNRQLPYETGGFSNSHLLRYFRLFLMTMPFIRGNVRYPCML